MNIDRLAKNLLAGCFAVAGLLFAVIFALALYRFVGSPNFSLVIDMLAAVLFFVVSLLVFLRMTVHKA